MPDEQAVKHLIKVCRLSKKRIVPAKVKYNAFRVSRSPNAVTVHLLNEEEETGRVSFVPGPNFSQIR